MSSPQAKGSKKAFNRLGFSLHPFRGWGFLLFLLIHTIASFYYISRQNITFDEPNYIEYSKRWLHGTPERIHVLDDSKSPIVAICWIPRIVRQVINPNYQLNDYGRQDQKDGRYMMIVFSLLAAVYVYWWCKDLYGSKGWIFPMLLLLFDPLFLAYSTLITTDLACGTFLVALLFHFKKYLQTGSYKQFLLAAIFTGIAIITKQSLLFILLLLPLMALLFSYGQKLKLLPKRMLLSSGVFILVVLLVINIAYYFHHSFTLFGKYEFVSNTMQLLQQSLSFLHWMPVPLPEPYVQSIDMLQRQAEIGGGELNSSYSGVYLLGEYKANGGFWYYYFVLLWYKMPIGTLAILVGCMFMLAKNFRIKSFVKEYQFVLLPIVYFLVILSFFNKFQIGIRHLLIIYPLLFVGVGYLFYKVALSTIPVKLTAYAAIIFSFISVAGYYPDLIPFTNEFVINKKEVYKKIYDSSIDYGQADSTIPGFLEQHPEYKMASSKPGTGKYIVLMGEVMDYNVRDKPVHPWYQKMKADSLMKHVILLYDIKEENLREAGFTK